MKGSQVPSLGSKTFTFAQRPSDGGEFPRAGKDLIYVSDLVGAGADLVETIRKDIGEFSQAGGKERHYLRRAHSHLSLLKGGGFAPRIDAASEILHTRDGLTGAEARALLLGALASVTALCEDVLG